jgi:hypothetical protein
MGWWETLTAGQGTLLGAMFVVLAAVIAFSTGWLDRRIQQRRFHYNEVKAVYAEALELAYFFSAADQSSELDDKRVMAAVERLFGVSGVLALTGKTDSVEMLVSYVNQLSDAAAIRRSLEKAGLQPVAQALRSGDAIKNVGPITHADIEQKLRRELATYLPLTDWHYRRILRRWGEHDSAPETTQPPRIARGLVLPNRPNPKTRPSRGDGKNPKYSLCGVQRDVFVYCSRSR